MSYNGSPEMKTHVTDLAVLGRPHRESSLSSPVPSADALRSVLDHQPRDEKRYKSCSRQNSACRAIEC